MPAAAAVPCLLLAGAIVVAATVPGRSSAATTPPPIPASICRLAELGASPATVTRAIRHHVGRRVAAIELRTAITAYCPTAIRSYR